MEEIVIVGFGWVGQANGLALSKAGYRVHYFDVATPVFRYSDAYGPVYDAIKPLKHVLEKETSNTWYIVCVGDKVSDSGDQDISHIKEALKSLEKVKDRVILRSTIIPDHLASLPFAYYLPEFLHEKRAVEECMKPHYFVVGKKSVSAREPGFFSVWRRAAVKVFEGTPEEASYLKYLSNVWNALRIAFVNEFGNAMELPTDREKVAKNEKLINFFFEEKSYLRYGRSFAGHCLPKDTRAFYRWHKDHGKDMSLIEGVCRSNDNHRVIEGAHPHLPEWFAEWVRPQISGWVALGALRASVERKMKKVINRVIR